MSRGVGGHGDQGVWCEKSDGARREAGVFKKEEWIAWIVMCSSIVPSPHLNGREAKSPWFRCPMANFFTECGVVAPPLAEQ